MVEQHAQAVDGQATGFLAHLHQLGFGGLVDAVLDGDAGVQKRCVGNGGLAFQLPHADGRCVRQQLGIGELLAEVVQIVGVVERHIAAGFLGYHGNFLASALPRLAVAAAEHHDLAHAVEGGLRGDGGSGAAHAHLHHLLALALHAGIGEGGHEAVAVGVVAGEHAVVVHHGVNRADDAGGRVQLVQVGHNGDLVRHGKVAAARIQEADGVDGLRHVISGNGEGHVRVVEPGALERQVVHGGRFAVMDGVAEQGAQAGGSGYVHGHGGSLLRAYVRRAFGTFPASPHGSLHTLKSVNSVWVEFIIAFCWITALVLRKSISGRNRLPNLP